MLVGVLLVGASFAASWGARLVSAMMGSRLTDRTNLSLGGADRGAGQRGAYLEHFERPEYLAEIERPPRPAPHPGGVATPGPEPGAIGRPGGLGGRPAGCHLPARTRRPIAGRPPRVGRPLRRRARSAPTTTWPTKRRLLGELFNLASTAAPRELRTFGITNALLARHSRLGDEVNAQSLRAARLSALWEALGWAGYAAGFAAGVIVLVLRAAHGHGSPGEVVEAVSLVRRSQRQLGGATDTAGNFATATVTAGRLLWLEDYASDRPAPAGTAVPGTLHVGHRLGGGRLRLPRPRRGLAVGGHPEAGRGHHRRRGGGERSGQDHPGQAAHGHVPTEPRARSRSTAPTWPCSTRRSGARRQRGRSRTSSALT